jgi:hypothetical protein
MLIVDAHEDLAWNMLALAAITHCPPQRPASANRALKLLW